MKERELGKTNSALMLAIAHVNSKEMQNVTIVNNDIRFTKNRVRFLLNKAGISYIISDNTFIMANGSKITLENVSP